MFSVGRGEGKVNLKVNIVLVCVFDLRYFRNLDFSKKRNSVRGALSRLFVVFVWIIGQLAEVSSASPAVLSSPNVVACGLLFFRAAYFPLALGEMPSVASPQSFSLRLYKIWELAPFCTAESVVWCMAWCMA